MHFSGTAKIDMCTRPHYYWSELKFQQAKISSFPNFQKSPHARGSPSKVTKEYQEVLRNKNSLPLGP